MRYSIIFFAALFGSATATQVGELEDRDIQDAAVSALQERAPVMRPPGWKGIGMPYRKTPFLPKGRPSRPKRLRDLDALEERDLFEDSFSALQERAPVMRPPGWKGIGRPYPKTPFLPKGRPTRRKRDLDELESRPFQRRAMPGSMPRRIGSGGSRPNKFYYKGLAAPRRRPRDVEELDERDLYEDAWFDSEE
ncbi:unnamed protein product [Clonostachys byssicola]|uniref:Uncharacterized protein n=1 Tax=Clonostachys byssicola TaxID=160290 RepID=A0A9N9UEH1_9HYPO|nr:unnamed protein product [Clonostachys byssicola]